MLSTGGLHRLLLPRYAFGEDGLGWPQCQAGEPHAASSVTVQSTRRLPDGMLDALRSHS